MNQVIFVVLIILDVLIKIGKVVRFPFIIFYSLASQVFNKVNSIITQKIRLSDSKSKKISKPEVFSSLHVRIRQLPKLYREALINSLKIITPKIPKVTFPKFKIKSTLKIKSSFKKTITSPMERFSRWLLKPTSTHPFVIFPTALMLAQRIKWFFAGVVLTILFVMTPFMFYSWLSDLPNPMLLSRRDLEVASKIFDRNGVLLYEIYSDKNRTPVPLTQIPLYVQQATIAIEDRTFYHHQGFSIRGTIRALKETFLNHRIQGGSTITQQLIKSALLNPEISVTRKIRELVLAFWAERLYTKNQILEMYLNQVPYGGTAWGIESASQTYFGKQVLNLTLAEASYLAGLPAAPSSYSPYGTEPQMGLIRQNEVLRRMVEDGYIKQTEAEIALQEKLNFKSPRNGILAPHFVMYVKELLEKRYGPRMVVSGGLRVTTSLDINIQKSAQEIVSKRIAELVALKVGNGASVITKPQTGEILAMVGSRDYFDQEHDGNVNVTTALRQPGSSIKVVTYTAALENGFTASTLLEDTPVAYRSPGSPTYAPVNYDGKYHGIVPFRYALANSYNIPAVKTLARIGLEKMIEKGRLMGITSWDDSSRFGLALTLGGGEVTMLDMTRVFGTLANYGKQVELVPVLEVSDYTGRILERNNNPKTIQATTPEIAWIISNILSDNQARSAAFGPNSSLIISGKTVSVKTGTTNEKRDNWTIGYTPSYVVAVWVGNNDNSPMDPVLTSGITGAAPIWQEIMKQLLNDKPDEQFLKPQNIVEIPCYYGRNEYFIRGTEPTGNRCIPLPTLSPTPTPK